MTLLIAPQLMGPLGQYGIKHAALFDGSTGYLSRTPGATGNRKTFDIFGWVKLCTDFNSVTYYNMILGARVAATSYTGLWIGGGSSGMGLIHRISGSTVLYPQFNTVKLRDLTGWYPFHFAVDTTQATASAAYIFKIGGQGSEVISLPLSATTHVQNTDTYINLSGTPMYQAFDVSVNAPATGFPYYAHTGLVDGGGTAFEDFFKVDPSTGNWAPKNIQGITWGTNGVFFKYGNAANLGEDSSGNGNDFTVTGTVTQSADTPTNNHATLNPLCVNNWNASGAFAFSNGNKTANDTAASNYGFCWTTFVFESGKHSVQATYDTAGASAVVGAGDPSQTLTNAVNVRYAASAGQILNDATTTQTGLAVMSVTDTIEVLVDADARQVVFKVNGITQGTPETISGSSPIGIFCGNAGTGNSSKWTLDAGTDGYTPSDAAYKTLCTDNLPARSPKVPSTPQTGSFTGNANADGPFINLGMAPDQSGASTINGNAITWGAHADACATGFKLRTSSASYNAAGTNTYSIAVAAYTGGRNIPPATAQ
jgi:hypothetical protein